MGAVSLKECSDLTVNSIKKKEQRYLTQTSRCPLMPTIKIYKREREGELLLEGVRDMKGERDNREKEKKLKKKNLRLSTKAPLP